MNELTKQCSKCREVKPIREYTFQDKEMNLRHSQCSDCKYWPKPKDGSCLRKCSDCNIPKHYKDDFPASQSCCKPCHTIRKKLARTGPSEEEWEATPIIFTQEVCRIVLDGEEPTIFCKGRCQKNIPKSEFHKGNNTICKHCIQYDKHVQSRDVYWYLTYLYNSAKDRTKHEFSITIDEWYDIYFNQKGLSALSGKSMTHCVSPSLIEYEKYPDNISPDRKDSSKGYTKDNVQFCRWYENSMKNNMTEKDFFERVCEIADFYRNNIYKYK